MAPTVVKAKTPKNGDGGEHSKPQKECCQGKENR